MTVSKTFWLTFDNVESFSLFGLAFHKVPESPFPPLISFPQVFHAWIFSQVFLALSLRHPPPLCSLLIASGRTKHTSQMRECREDEFAGSQNNMQMDGHFACSLSLSLASFFNLEKHDVITAFAKVFACLRRHMVSPLGKEAISCIYN